MAGLPQGLDTVRGHTHPVFMIFDFFRHSDDHGRPFLSGNAHLTSVSIVSGERRKENSYGQSRAHAVDSAGKGIVRFALRIAHYECRLILTSQRRLYIWMLGKSHAMPAER